VTYLIPCLQRPARSSSYDINGFVEAISGLVNDPARWQAINEAGQRRTPAEFTLDATGRRFDELIQACLRGEYPLPPRLRRAWLSVNPLSGREPFGLA
jgi:hypothetical protein